MSFTAQATLSEKELSSLPDEVTFAIVCHMDDPSCVCFALTSHKNYDIVTKVKQKPLKELCPQFTGSMYVMVDGTSQHEQFIRQLWKWLGMRCAFCGVTEADVQEYKQGEWKYERHVCRGWLNRPRPPAPRNSPLELRGAWGEWGKELDKCEFGIVMAEFQTGIRAGRTTEMVESLKKFFGQQQQPPDLHAKQ